MITTPELLSQLSVNLALVTGLILLYSLIPFTVKKAYPKHIQVFLGVFFGAFAVFSMQFPVTIAPGVIVDAKTILIPLAGFFFGPWTAFLAASIAAIFRIYLGGVGMFAGVYVIVSGAIIGVAFFNLWLRKKILRNFMILVIFGLIISVNALLGTFILPLQLALAIIPNIWAVILTVYPVSTLLVSSLFNIIEERDSFFDEALNISQGENKRREELEKLREISASMRQADRSGNLLQVFTQEVQEFCQAEVASSILFKSPKELVTYSSPTEDIQLTQKQSEAITVALLNAKTDNLDVSIPGFETSFILPLQSADTVHGALMVASRTQAGTNQAEQNMLNAIADMAGTALHRIDILETLEQRVQRRTHDLVVLYNLITIISENWRLQDLLELSMVLTLETVNADRGIIYLTDGKENPDLKPIVQRGFSDGFQIEIGSLPGDALAQEVFKQQKPLSLEDLSDQPAYKKFDGMASGAGIPILTRGEIRGVFSLFANEKDVFGADEMALLASIADHLGIGIENSILIEQSRENAALEERNRLARNLHDSVSQLLYSLTLMAGTTKKMLARDVELDDVKISVDRFADTAHQALKEMRLLLYELRPAVLDSEGLVVALQNRIETVEERLGLRVRVEANGLPELPSAMEDALYHIALEALNNIVKHSGSTKASIVFSNEDMNVTMEIADEGRGFDTTQPSKGMGLRNMRERGQMLGGEVVINSEPGQGTRVTANAKIPSVSLVES